uniref:trinucleotide repeat-containing gene 6C protein-like isoform X1 n=1 Tax=Styela clava TaxID=7725 RepID=UPI001939657B|nr:trinucleotide repeat-containing gene 6C protein-like isoform X1 [Styela clava]
MTSGTDWQTKYNSNESSLTNAGWGAAPSGTVSSPVLHPESWPQLGSEQEVVQGQEMHQQPSQSFGGNLQQPDPGGWGGGGISGDTNTATTSNGWGTPQQSTTGWGVPDSGGNNWSRQPQVDNGTAVWGKPSNTGGSSGGWGAPSNQSPAQSAWNIPPQTTPSAAAQSSSQPEQQHQTGPSQHHNSIPQQPESWAAAAAAPPAQGQASHQPPVSQQNVPKDTETDQAQTQLQQAQSPSDSQDAPPNGDVDPNDPVQKLVNSHEGWGKKPILQNTSWDISESPNFVRQPPNKTGTEAWGKTAAGQPASGGWQGNNNVATGTPSVRGWGPNSNPIPQQPRPSWGGATQPTQAQPGWGEARLPPPMPTANVNRWNTPPTAMPNSNQGWGASGVQQGNNPSGNWGNTTPTDGGSWGNAAQRNSQSNWGNTRPGPESSWNQTQNMQRQSSQVDDGTSAWGDPTAYKSVNMWDKKQGMGMNMGGMGDASKTKAEPTGWGAQPGSQNLPNKPPSPTGWGDGNPPVRQPNVDNGTSNWGKPPPVNSGSNWDQNSNWGNKPSAGNTSGWGNTPEQPGQQWGQTDANSGWNQTSIKNDIAGDKNGNFGFVDRKPSTGSDSVFEEGHIDGGTLGTDGNGHPGMNYSQFPSGQSNNLGMPGMNGPRPVPPQPLMNPNMQTQYRQQGPPMPPQLQNQLQQIRHAVMKGVIPQQMLNPQLMTPQHLNLLQQLVMKTTEYQQLTSKMNMLNKPNLPPQLRQQHEQTALLLRQCQQQIQAYQRALTQNMLQKTNPLQAKSNVGAIGPGSGLGLDFLPPSSSSMPPGNNTGLSSFSMSSMSQNLPGSGFPNREQQSRLHSWRRPSLGIDGPSDTNPPDQSPSSMMPSISDMIEVQSGLLPPSGGPEPIGQSRITGGGLLGLQQMPDATSMQNTESNGPDQNGSNGMLNQTDKGLTAENIMEDNSDVNNESLKNILADIGPPEFIPGKKWAGFRPIDPENDPDITPGSVAIAKTMSVNTVKDVDQVLNRDRYTNSQVGSPSSANEAKVDSLSLASSFANTLSDNPGMAASSSTWSTSGGGTSLGHTPTTLTHELWKVPLPKQSSNPGNRPPQGWSSGPASSWSTLPNTQSSSRYSVPNGPPEGSWADNKTWVVLTNLNPQMDFSNLRNLCSMKGNMLSFQQNYPVAGMVLVRYSSSEDAIHAKKSLNMSMTGNVMLVASIASDQEVNNFVSASVGGNWNSGPTGGQSRFTSRHSFGSSGTLLSNQQQQQPNYGSNPMMHNSASTGDLQHLWSTGGNNPGMGGFASSQQGTSWSTGGNTPAGRAPSGGMWGNTSSTGYDDPSRMMSPLHSLLPENLLGEQQM